MDLHECVTRSNNCCIALWQPLLLHPLRTDLYDSQLSPLLMHIHCNNDVYHYLLLSPSTSHDVHRSEGHAIYIYAIRNVANDRRYIGSTTDMDNRYEQHKRKPPNRMTSDASLYQPFEDNFVMTCLETVYTQARSKQAEYYWIRHYNTQAAAGYNIYKGAPTTDKRYWFLKRLGVLH